MKHDRGISFMKRGAKRAFSFLKQGVWFQIRVSFIFQSNSMKIPIIKFFTWY